MIAQYPIVSSPRIATRFFFLSIAWAVLFFDRYSIAWSNMLLPMLATHRCLSNLTLSYSFNIYGSVSVGQQSGYSSQYSSLSSLDRISSRSSTQTCAKTLSKSVSPTDYLSVFLMPSILAVLSANFSLMVINQVLKFLISSFQSALSSLTEATNPAPATPSSEIESSSSNASSIISCNSCSLSIYSSNIVQSSSIFLELSGNESCFSRLKSD